MFLVSTTEFLLFLSANYVEVFIYRVFFLLIDFNIFYQVCKYVYTIIFQRVINIDLRKIFIPAYRKEYFAEYEIGLNTYLQFSDEN